VISTLPEAGSVHEATEAELADWDRRTVDVAGGQVFQSRSWARHRAATGWIAHHLVCFDGRAVLALRRPWPVVGGSRAYLPRGPVTGGDSPDQVANRLAAVTRWLAGRGVDVVTSDAELPVSSGYGDRLEALGFRPVEELQPARHRLSVPLAGVDEDVARGRVAKPTRQRIQRAEDSGIVVRRFDGRLSEVTGPGFDAGPGFEAGASNDLEAALVAFHQLVQQTGRRRGFRLGPLGPFLAWLTAAHAAGHAIYLEAVARDHADAPGDGAIPQPDIGRPPPARAGERVVAGLLLYRQGDRLTTAISGDDEAARSSHPGALHLLRWRSIQLAIREGRAEMDLGGVDVAGARHEPRPGDAMHGLYQHKRSFGAMFVEQVGAHERVLRPIHLAVARSAARLAGGIRG
jgi:lipid II:glycine glycyltransferase (peptidoglycan interpeptide bridge formation enzyme)